MHDAMTHTGTNAALMLDADAFLLLLPPKVQNYLHYLYIIVNN
jgi:hypothetical protein